jgi:hypothetical protein
MGILRFNETFVDLFRLVAFSLVFDFGLSPLISAASIVLGIACAAVPNPTAFKKLRRLNLPISKSPVKQCPKFK